MNTRDDPILHLRHILKVKEQHFYCSSIFHSHSRVFNNENNSYLKVSIKWSLQLTLYFCCLTLHLVYLCSFYVIWCVKYYFLLLIYEQENKIWVFKSYKWFTFPICPYLIWFKKNKQTFLMPNFLAHSGNT